MTPDDANNPSSPGEAADPLARQVRWLEDLARLSAERVAAETRIEAQFQAANNSATRAAEDIRRALATELEIERRDVASDFAEQRRHASSRFQHETTATEREQTEVEQQAAKDYDKTLRRAGRKLHETRWETETLFEAAKEIAPRQLKEFVALVDGWLERGRDERDEAQRLLAVWRQSWREPQPPELPPELPPREGADATADALALLQQQVNSVIEARERLARLRVPALAAGMAPLWVSLIVGLLLAGGAVISGQELVVIIGAPLVTLTLGAAGTFYLRSLARRHVEAIQPGLARAAAEAELWGARAMEQGKARAAAQQAEVVERRQRTLAAAAAEHQSKLASAETQRDTRLSPLTEIPRRLQEIAARRDRDLELAEAVRVRREAELRQKESQQTITENRYRRQIQEIEDRRAAQWRALADEWRAGLARIEAGVEQIWNDETLGNWLAEWNKLAACEPTMVVPPAIRFGRFRVGLDQVPSGVPAEPSLAEMTPGEYMLPAIVPFPDSSSLVFRAHGNGRRPAVEAMQAVMLRLLVTIPPGKLRFTIVDPVGLGENFAAFMHLADYSEALVASRIWTEPRHIEQRLADLSEHMENVIQKYLRNEYASIAQYNRQAGEVAEPFRVLVIANFPANFSEAAQRRLASIAASGARCGVFLLMMVDTQLPLAAGVSLKDFERSGATLIWSHNQFAWKHERFGRFQLALDAPPPPAQLTEMLQTAGRRAVEASRVEVPFEVIAPAASDYWTSSARSGIDVPLGRAGATRLQAMKLGQGTSQHVFIAGKTGSGKSTLLHALVTNLALRYSPDEIELYLVDFKQGVEFKTYATHRLPHARVVAIESDREFGTSVLGRLDAELRERAEQFRALGVQDLAGFREAEPTRRMPRILAIVDEFQEFFVEDDKIAQDAGLLLDRLVRQGRAFGIHVLLGSQTLAGTYTLARSTIGQMAVRIALQCSETDAHLILSEDNSAARLLSRAGEAIYNDSNGLVEGNHPFQIVWLGDERREKYLEHVQTLATRREGAPLEQIVFEGNVAADPARNTALAELLAAGRPTSPAVAPRAWLGEAVAIKEPTSIVLRRQSGANLLVVGQNEDAALGIMATALASLWAQQPAAEPAAEPAALDAGSQVIILDGAAAGSEQSERLRQIAALVPEGTRVATWRELPAVVNELAAGVERRQKIVDAETAPVFVFVYGVQKLRDLRRQEDDFSFSRSGDQRPPDPGKQFAAILKDGPAVGVHVLAWCDNVNNLNRTWERATLREFEMRVAFQMSVNDSSMLIDTPAASKLGAHRALYHSEEQEVLEKFRPYRAPSKEWLAWAGEQLQQPPGKRNGRSPKAPVSGTS